MPTILSRAVIKGSAAHPTSPNEVITNNWPIPEGDRIYSTVGALSITPTSHLSHEQQAGDPGNVVNRLRKTPWDTFWVPSESNPADHPSRQILDQLLRTEGPTAARFNPHRRLLSPPLAVPPGTFHSFRTRREYKSGGVAGLGTQSEADTLQSSGTVLPNPVGHSLPDPSQGRINEKRRKRPKHQLSQLPLRSKHFEDVFSTCASNEVVSTTYTTRSPPRGNPSPPRGTKLRAAVVKPLNLASGIPEVGNSGGTADAAKASPTGALRKNQQGNAEKNIIKKRRGPCQSLRARIRRPSLSRGMPLSVRLASYNPTCLQFCLSFYALEISLREVLVACVAAAIVILRRQKKRKRRVNLSSATGANLLATNTSHQYVKCVDIYPQPEPDILLAIGQANGKVVLTTFGPTAFDTLGLAGKELGW
uniref:Uncharacterized protein n=1 Tax=Timema genevievae TaxID=629358 RepID=A0A7R9PQS2_TIMGE|nr:unnamed protein product [Timema genevievae]